MRKTCLGLLAMLMMPLPVLAIEIGGITLPDVVQSEPELMLNGAGIRTKFILKIYVAGLYLVDKNDNAAKIISAEEPMAIRLHILSPKLTSEKLTKATEIGFDNSTGGNVSGIAVEIEQFLAVFSDEISVDDVFQFLYTPEIGTIVTKNDLEITIIDSSEFKKALFGIWLSDKPAQAHLKGALLGR